MFFFLGRAFPWNTLSALHHTFLLSKTHTANLKTTQHSPLTQRQRHPTPWYFGYTKYRKGFIPV